ncbi:MAG: hypothetical protein E6248_11240 [Clostridium sp.]|uniref:hypothetical protein n=1 Tax=Clostridium sp. TaxID=1506 RepID=UPI0029136E3E|nr:hypothetical protein [Clostridium sp.]MDU5111014.1 hypothetical protein [Clostridium sp.]
MKKNATNLSGNNLYLDRYGDTVYYNIFDKNGYIVSKQVEQKFRLFYYRYSIIFIVMILLGDYFNSLQNTLLVGGGAIVLVELYFRLFFLKKLKVIKDFKRERKTSILESTINSKEKEKTMMKAIAYVLLSILIIINAIQQNFNIIFLILSGLVAVYSFYIAIINTIAFSRMKKL